jgi:hypothetical protein
MAVRTIRGAVIAVIGSLSLFAAGSALAGPSPLANNYYAANLDLNWGYPGATSLDQYGGAILGGQFSASGSGLALNDIYNNNSGNPLGFSANASGAQTNLGTNLNFNFLYTFTLASSSDPTGGIYVDQVPDAASGHFTINGLALALYNGSDVKLAGAGGSLGASNGEVTLDYTGLLGPGTYTLAVSGSANIEQGFTSGGFTGNVQVSPVPVPGALLLFGTALLGLGGFAGRGKLRTLASRLGQRTGRAAALLAIVGTGIGVVANSDSANAATYTDIGNLGVWSPSKTPFNFDGQINLKRSPVISTNGTTNAVTGSGTLSNFVFDFEFTLNKNSSLDAIISNPTSLNLTSADFELFKGTPGSGTLVAPSPDKIATPGALQLYYSDLTGGGTKYFLQVMGSLAPKQTSGNATGLATVSAVPLPGALLAFGSGLVGLVAVSRRRARRHSA